MDYSYFIALSNADFLSFHEKYLLIMEFGSPERIFKTSYAELAGKHIISGDKIQRLARVVPDNKVSNLLHNKGIKLCCVHDSEYPRQLLEIYSPPILLYYFGRIPKKQCIAIVGSRKTTKEGRMNAFASAELLSGSGYCIISGLARGIDSCAHLGALEKGTTAAILGSGIDICYPPENKYLMERIKDNGCIISEFAPGKKPSRYTFPARNRIISGMSKAVIIVEAARKSGSLITSDFALEQGRDVLVFQNKKSTLSEGSDSLIEEGAIPLEDVNSLRTVFDLGSGSNLDKNKK